MSGNATRYTTSQELAAYQSEPREIITTVDPTRYILKLCKTSDDIATVFEAIATQQINITPELYGRMNVCSTTVTRAEEIFYAPLLYNREDLVLSRNNPTWLRQFFHLTAGKNDPNLLEWFMVRVYPRDISINTDEALSACNTCLSDRCAQYLLSLPARQRPSPTTISTCYKRNLAALTNILGYDLAPYSEWEALHNVLSQHLDDDQKALTHRHREVHM